MPLPMVHLLTGHKVLPVLTAQYTIDLSQYYLGCIAPDAIHKRKSPAPDAKAVSHLKGPDPVDTGIWKQNIVNFLDTVKESPSYRQGYAVHLLTDYYWGLYLMPAYDTRYQADKHPVKDWRMAYYNDTDILDKMLYDTEPWRPAVWEHLRRARGETLEGLVSGSEADAWNRHVLLWYDSLDLSSYQSLRYIRMQDITEFLTKAVASILADLQ